MSPAEQDPRVAGGDDFDRSAAAVDARWGEDVADFYAGRGFGQRVGFGQRPALLVIDMIVAFTDPSYGVGVEQTATVQAIAELLARVRARGWPVYFTTTAYEPGGHEGGVFVEKMPALRELVVGTHAVEIDPRLAPEPGEAVILKKFPSPFHGTNLLSLLVTDRVDTLVLCGCTTSGCVRAAAIDGVSYGFRITVPEEAVSDRAAGPHWANLFDINAKYGDVLPISDVLELIAREPAAPQP